MKLRNKIIALSFSCILLAGCGAKSYDMYEENGSVSSMAAQEYIVEEGPAEREEIAFDDSGSNKISPTANPNAPSAKDFERKIIRNSRLRLETKDFDEAIPYIINMVEDMGGYIQNQTVNGSSLYNKSERFERNANITARIPFENLDSVQGALDEKFNVTERSDYTNDITDNYYDVMAHLNTLKAQEEKLMELLGKAEKLEDVIQIESALADCRYQIDSLTGQIKRMDNQVSYCTVDIHLREVIEYQNKPPLTFGEKVKNSFQICLRQLKNLFSGIFFFIIEDLLVVLIEIAIFVSVVLFGVWIIRKISRKLFKDKKNFLPKKEDKPENNSDNKTE